MFSFSSVEGNIQSQCEQIVLQPSLRLKPEALANCFNAMAFQDSRDSLGDMIQGVHRRDWPSLEIALPDLEVPCIKKWKLQ